MAQDLKSPQYVALSNKHAAVCEALETSGSITRVSEKLKTKGLVDGDVETTNANQVLQAVTNKIGYSRQSFYDLVDALNECDLPTAIGQTLEKECETLGGQRPIGSTGHPQSYPPQSTPQQPYPASQQPYPASQQPYPAHQLPYPAPQQPYPAQQQPYSNPQQPYPATQQSYPAHQQPYPAPQQPYPAPQQPYPGPQQSYPTPQQPYSNPQQPYPAPQQPYSAPQQPYPTAQQSYPSPQLPYLAPQQLYPTPQQPYPPSQQPYLAPQQPYPTPQQPYPPSQQPYPAPQQPYPAPQQPYPSQPTQQSNIPSSTGASGGSAEPPKPAADAPKQDQKSRATKRPTFSELVSIQKSDGTNLKVMDHIYSTLTHKQVLEFGYKLLNDNSRVKRIAREHGKDDEMIVHDIFKSWLARDDSNKMDPALPRTWLDLARCLEETNDDLGELVHDLREHFD